MDKYKMVDIQVTLVLEIEKYPELYNYKLAAYSRKDITERAWAKISNKTQLPVNECKEKWRNIRSTYMRSLKAPSSGSKPKKPYYLKEYLSFVLPFVRPVNELPSPGNIPIPPTEENNSSTANQEAEVVHEDIEEQITADNNENEPNVNQPEDTLEEPAASPPGSSQIGGKRRRKNSNLDGAMLTYLKRKNDQQTKPPQHKNSTMNHFFLSIINEFEDMTEQEIRRYKISTLQLIDDIKRGRQSHTPNSIVSLPSISSSLSQYWSNASPVTPTPPPQPSPSPVHVPYDLSSNLESNDFL